MTTISAEGFRWAEDGTVIVSLPQTSTALADSDRTGAAIKLAALQRKADQYTTTLRGALRVAGATAQAVADNLTAAFDQLPEAAQGARPGSLTDPAAAGRQGTDDGRLVASGKATDADLQRIAARLAAAGLTADDVTAVDAGQHVELPEAQWDYLHEFYNTAGLNGLTSMSERLSALHDTTAAATVADQLNTLSNPNVIAASHDPLPPGQHRHGGLDQLPADLRNVLTADYQVRPGRPSANLGAYGLSRVAHMIDLADSRSAPGSEINKQLILRASDIAPRINPYVTIDTDWRHGTAEGLAQVMLDAGGRDKIAVHDVLTDTGLPIGAHTTVLDNLLHHHWADDGAGVQKMLSWVESDATDPNPAISGRAGETAFKAADYLASHKSTLLHLDGDKGPSLGEVNPLTVRGLGSALGPYIADMVGVESEFLNTRQFGTLGDATAAGHPGAQAIFSVIDSDRDAAVSFDTKALSTAQQLQSTWLQSALADPENPHNELATKSGTILGLVDRGLSDELDTRKETEIRKAVQAFAEEGAGWDTGKGVVSTGVKLIPVVKDVFGPIIDVSNSFAKMNLIGLAYEAPDPASAHYDTSHEYAPARALYQVAQVLETKDGSLGHDPRYDNLFTDGRLKSYDNALSATSSDPTILESRLENILNAYHGGMLHEHLQDFLVKIQEGRSAVR
ncbi:TPR repeat region-containing protein [Nocardia aurantia]|uniref:TPR repeat region-containing protein n=1 Tax=Nocardia aurantia TaxID=2585199 RepID=UPI001D12269B|nr:hypothetical protein [Nocardia aurantia]